MTYNINPKSLANLKLGANPNPRPRVNAISCHRLLLALLDGATKYQAAEETGLSYNTVSDYINAMHKPSDGTNLVYISQWLLDANGRPSTAVFMWGPGVKDAKRRRKTIKQINRDMRARKLERMALHGLTSVTCDEDQTESA